MKKFQICFMVSELCVVGFSLKLSTFETCGRTENLVIRICCMTSRLLELLTKFFQHKSDLKKNLKSWLSGSNS